MMLIDAGTITVRHTFGKRSRGEDADAGHAKETDSANKGDSLFPIFA